MLSCNVKIHLLKCNRICQQPIGTFCCEKTSLSAKSKQGKMFKVVCVEIYKVSNLTAPGRLTRYGCVGDYHQYANGAKSAYYLLLHVSTFAPLGHCSTSAVSNH